MNGPVFTSLQPLMDAQGGDGCISFVLPTVGQPSGGFDRDIDGAGTGLFDPARDCH
ncbi:hypothetical protein LX32DRAFT_636848 [Colletotrichum zoysiae]|uniref:Uncharacterized protein n=1 Tax=Colletotrichum zoysiae TaxID=1216348 RepID=A0AAD9HP12_9PEZI|nr:hypothetical protein LX32DRAFT_636848 [Colletotrichum zoysiae]